MLLFSTFLGEAYTLPETNMFALKIGGWKTIFSFWGVSLFSGANCSFKKSSDFRRAEIKIIYQINSRHSVFLAKFQIFFVGGDCSRKGEDTKRASSKQQWTLIFRLQMFEKRTPKLGEDEPILTFAYFQLG